MLENSATVLGIVAAMVTIVHGVLAIWSKLRRRRRRFLQ